MRKLSVVLVFLFMSTFTFGQFGFGIKGAVTASSFPTDASDIKNVLNPGYQLGAFVRIGDKWHLQPEAYLTSKTGTLKYDVASTSVEQKIILNAVDIPILIGVKIFDPPLMNIRLQAGPVASIVNKKTFNVTLDGVKQADPSEEYKESFNDLNWGLQFGAGVDVLFLTIDLRYEMGLNNIYTTPDNIPASPFQDIKNNLFMLSVGWKIL